MTCALPPQAQAQTEPEAYALVIGSNRGGAGQHSLSYAEGDAVRMAQLLEELGRTPKANITRLMEPTPAQVEGELRTLRAQLEQRRDRGVKTQVLFYYSGHARAQALSLGAEELDLARLRNALSALPSTLTVVVLDACQSGAFSGVKGARAAADFSVSSVHSLDTRGIAVLASSSGSELSQESPELSGGYFTHHLTVGLRGAGDADGNGRVSLDEAYRYAYDRTLSATSRTQVGGQHATLETNLAGRGDVALSYPVDADALLVLPEALLGRVLVQRRGRGAVLAELTKVAGHPLSVALPSAAYDVLVRDPEQPQLARECKVDLQHGKTVQLETALCQAVTLPDPNQKGEDPNRHEVWFVELGISGSAQHNDDYTHTLEQFRYAPKYELDLVGGGFKRQDQRVFLEGALGASVHRHLSILGRFDSFERRAFYRDLSGPNWAGRQDVFDWRTQAVSVGARGRLLLWKEYLVGIAELSLGLAMARSTYAAEDLETTHWNFGPALRGALGLNVGFNDHVGMYFTGGYALVRALKNDLGETHNDGGYFGSFGMRMRSMHWWW
jgi:hypothetical protein